MGAAFPWDVYHLCPVRGFRGNDQPPLLSDSRNEFGWRARGAGIDIGTRPDITDIGAWRIVIRLEV